MDENEKSSIVDEISAEVEKYTGERPHTVNMARALDECIRATHKKYGGPDGEEEVRYIAGLRERHDSIEKRKFEQLEAEEPEELLEDYDDIPVLENSALTEEDYVDQLVAETPVGNKSAMYERDGITFKRK